MAIAFNPKTWGSIDLRWQESVTATTSAIHLSKTRLIGAAAMVAAARTAPGPL
jgi:hypothetical protein